MVQKIIVFIAPPGAGKGTQAELIAKKFGFYHLESSKILEEGLADRENSPDPEIRKAWELHKKGQLMTPSLVARMIIDEIKKLHDEGKSIVFSGSFRTLEEVEKEVPVVEELYGRENITFFSLTLTEAESIKRNSSRRICQKNRHSIPGFPEYANMVTCPEDGSPLIKRELDKPDIIRERFQVYKSDTEPVLDYLKKHGYDIITVHGEQPIGTVFEDISKHLQIHDSYKIPEGN